MSRAANIAVQWNLRWVSVATVLVLVFGLGVNALISFHKQREVDLESAREQLAAIADLKVAQIEHWRDERVNDAAFFLNPQIAENVHEWFAGNQATAQAFSLALMDVVQQQGQFQCVSLLDSQLGIRWSFPSRRLGLQFDPAISVLAAQALNTNRVIFSPLHRNSQIGEVLLDMAAPVVWRNSANHPETVGAVVFEINAATFLFPKIQSWPTPSATAEALIVCQESNDVVYLNELRHRTNTAFVYRRSMTQSNEVAAMALHGQTGILEGRDYRGSPVLAAARPIPGCRWMLLAKMDQDEILAPLRATSRAFMVTGGLLLSLAVLAGTLIWNDRERRFSLAQLTAQKALAEALEQNALRLRSFAAATFEGIVISEGGRIIDVNQQYLQMTGYKYDDLIGRDIQSLLSEASWAFVQQMIISGKETTYPCRTRCQDGTEIDCEVRARMSTWNGREARITAIRDVTERNRQELVLRQREQWLRQSQRVGRVGSYVLDATTGKWTGSEMLDEILGIDDSFPRIRGSWERLIHPADWPGVHSYSAAVYAQKQRFEKDYRIIRPSDGAERWVSGKGEFEFDKKGQPVRMCGVIQDITDRKHAEEAIRSSRLRLMEIIERTPAGYFYIDSDWNYRHVNPAWLRMHGFCSLDDVIGRPFTITLHPADHPAIEAMFARVTTAGISASGEMRRRLADGTVGYHIYSVTPVYKSEKVVGLEGFLIDATELHEAETRLREREHHYRSLIENSSDITAIIRQDAKILYVSPAGERLLGYPLEEMQGQSVLSFLRPDDHANLVAGIQKCIDLPEETHDLLVNCRHEDGSWRKLECLVRLHSTRDDGQSTIVVNSRDITERMRLEEQLRQSQKMEVVGRLVGGVAHDFNNILTAVLIHIGLIKDDTSLHAEVTDTLNELERELSRASALTRQLLLFSRQKVAQPKLLDLDEINRDLARMLRRTLGETIRLHLSDSSGVAWVKADPGMMEQVVMNLCINARDAMPDGGQLTVGTNIVEAAPDATTARLGARAGRFVCLSVADTGCGMSDAVLKRLFEPFFTTKEIGKGTGLGLATIQGIVKQHEGWIDVVSHLGHGSIFKVYLPAAQKPANPTANAIVSSAPQRGTESILLVDDDSSLRQVVALWLRRLGYAVFEAGNGVEALGVWRQHRSQIDMLFTDFVMPGDKDGLAMAECLWRENAGLRVIISSGYKFDAAQDRVRKNAHRMTFLPKPYDAGTLARVVREMLNQPAIPPSHSLPGEN